MSEDILEWIGLDGIGVDWGGVSVPIYLLLVIILCHDRVTLLGGAHFSSSSSSSSSSLVTIPYILLLSTM